MRNQKTTPEAATIPTTGWTLHDRVRYLSQKLIHFIWRYRKNPRYALVYLFRVLQARYRAHAKIMGDQSFIKEVHHRSSVRLGEGEITLLLGTRGIHFQNAHKVLREKLSDVISNYSDKSPYILSVPAHINIPNNFLHQHNQKYLWMPFKIYFDIFFQKHPYYGDAVYFYRDNKVREFLAEISTHKSVLMVTNAENIANLKELEREIFPHSRSVSYINTPATNAFDQYDTILGKIINYAEGHENTVAFCAFGPAGKIMIPDLASHGILTHDIGHGIPFLFENESQEWRIRWDVFGEKIQASKTIP